MTVQGIKCYNIAIELIKSEFKQGIIAFYITLLSSSACHAFNNTVGHKVCHLHSFFFNIIMR